MTEGLIRFGISISKGLLAQFDQLIQRQGYDNRSEAIRDLIRDRLVMEEWEDQNREVVGTVTLIYDHHAGGLNDSLLEVQHQHHQIIISNLHVHLDHHNCLEVLVIKGPADQARQMAEKLISTKGVKHGKLTLSSTGQELS